MRGFLTFSPAMEALALTSSKPEDQTERMMGMRLWRAEQQAGRDKRLAMGAVAAFAILAAAGAYKGAYGMSGICTGFALVSAPFVRKHGQRVKFLRQQDAVLQNEGPQALRRSLLKAING